VVEEGLKTGEFIKVRDKFIDDEDLVEQSSAALLLAVSLVSPGAAWVVCRRLASMHPHHTADTHNVLACM
jgi:hypothetical protein